MMIAEQHPILEKYGLTGLDINWDHVDVSTFAKEGSTPTGRITVTARRGSDTVTFSRYSTAEKVVAKAAKALDALL